ncbi:MAG: hypothetical protein COB73_06875 [Flavobacteriaceae bacterium]|nr:MAG: hypothetical protein COB73_06875 [Flavobacteriaceae bacterium]
MKTKKSAETIFMKDNSSVFKNTKLNKAIFVSSIFVCAFWILGQMFNVYHYALVGAIFEILWLPCIISIIGIPLISLYLLIKEKFNLMSLNIYSIIMTIGLLIIHFME